MGNERIAYFSGYSPKPHPELTGCDRYYIAEAPPRQTTVHFGVKEDVANDSEAIQLIAIASIHSSFNDGLLAVSKSAKQAGGTAEKRKTLPWVGGHINESDWDKAHGNLVEAARVAIAREVREETGLSICVQSSWPLYLYDCSSEKSAHHLALWFYDQSVHDGSGVTLDESELMPLPGYEDSPFVPLQDLITDGAFHFEPWGEMIVRSEEEKCRLHGDSSERESRIASLARIEGEGFASRYELCHELDGSFSVLGSGGSGIVLRARQWLTETVCVDRAIKFFVFREDIANKEQTVVAKDNFEQEIGNIIRLNHQNVIKAVDGGNATLVFTETSVPRCPYLVMEDMKGSTLKEYYDKKEVDGGQSFRGICPNEDKALDLCMQLIDAVIYLHGESFYHCDIAPKNVFFQSRGNSSHVVLGDLGVGITIDDKFEQRYPSGGDTVKVVGTKKYAPKKIQKLIGKMVSPAEFKSLQPGWDVFSLNATLKVLCDCAISAFENSGSDCASVRAYQAWLGESGNNVDILAMRSEANHLRPEQRIIAEVPELSRVIQNATSILIPPAPVVLTERYRSLVEHPVFMRLQNSLQILAPKGVFPSAVHNRYEHAIGTYETMRLEILGALTNDACLSVLDEETINLLLVGSLLINMIRFPLWYVFFEVRRPRSGKDKLYGALEDARIFDTCMEAHPNGCKSLADILKCDFDMDSKRICRALFPTSQGPKVEAGDRRETFVRALLNATICGRVIDYLVRDSYHIGRENAPDFSSIIGYLGMKPDGNVSLEMGGIGIAEQIVYQRYRLFKTVYWSEPCRLYAAIYIHALRSLDDVEIAKAMMKRMVTLTEKEVFGILEKQARCQGDEHLARLLAKHVKAARPHFKRMFAINRKKAPRGVEKFFDRYETEGIEWKVSCRSKLQSLLIEHIGKEYSIAISECEGVEEEDILVLIDIPDVRYKEMGEDIYVIEHDGTSTALSKHSEIVATINRDFDNTLRMLRVFLDSDLAGRLSRDTLSSLEKKVGCWLEQLASDGEGSWTSN